MNPKDIPAFPVTPENFRNSQSNTGMTLREYLAAKAMQSLIRSAQHGTRFGTGCEDTNSTYAHVAYSMADAMLKARES